MTAEEVIQHLATSGLGVAGETIFTESPDWPDDVLVVREYGGSAPEHSKERQAAVMERPAFQVTSRSKSYLQAAERAYSAFRALTGFSGELSGTGYASIRANQSPFPLGRDESGRETFVTNYSVIKQST